MHISPLMVIAALAFGSFASYMAYRRGRSPYTWFILGFLFGIFGIFAIFFASNKKPAVEAEPIETIHGPTDKFWFYLDPTEKKQGPMSLNTLTTLWKEGKVGLSTYVWHEEMSDWTPLREVTKKP